MTSKLTCAMTPTHIKVDMLKPSESRMDPLRGPFEIWIKTKELGWMCSAVRATQIEAEAIAHVLQANFEVDIRP